MGTGRLRKRERTFTQVSNVLITDKALSLKAKGLYSLINYYIYIPNFEVYKSHIASQCIEGSFSFESIWKELKDNGYLKVYKMTDEKGKFFYEYELLDEPEEPILEGEKKNPPPQFPIPGKPIPGKPISGKPRFGKQGVYNKTLSNNTLFNNNKKNKGKKFEAEREHSDEYYNNFIDNPGGKIKT